MEQYPLLSRSSTRPQAACESQRKLTHSDLVREGSEIQEEMFPKAIERETEEEKGNNISNETSVLALLRACSTARDAGQH